MFMEAQTRRIMSYFEKVINIETNEEILRPYTKEEIAELEKIASEKKALAEALEKETQTKAIAKADLLAKLGITEEEAKLLLS